MKIFLFPQTRHHIAETNAILITLGYLLKNVNHGYKMRTRHVQVSVLTHAASVVYNVLIVGLFALLVMSRKSIEKVEFNGQISVRNPGNNDLP